MDRAPHVLVVEDDDVARTALGRLLGERFSVDLAENGATALAVAATRWPDVVVTDLKMPIMDGIELTAKLREIERTLPVIVASSVDDVDRVVDSMRSGASDYLIKPIDYDALVATIERLLRATAASKQRDVDMRKVNSSLVEQLVQADANLETMKQVAEFRERLIGIIGHDLRNPLSAILMGASLLRSKSHMNDAASIAERITNSGRRMQRIVSELMDFTHARLGAFPVDPSAMDLRNTCEQIASELRIGVGAMIDVRVSGDCSGTWDAERLGQALSNIVGNAVDHADPGSHVTIDVYEGGAGAIAISVTNRGPSIPAKELMTIFEPFRRGEQATRRAGHLGLGLFIAREVVRAHRGTITAESGNGVTTFTIRLPRSPADEEVHSPSGRADPSSSS